MIGRIRKHIKVIACFMAVNLLAEVIAPNVALALTGGPSQPEVQSFEPVGTSEMVDLFSGDFNYNIPLLDVDGYPVNIAYHSGVGMDDEGSWTGLGWNINPGVINRSMRGLPDDFSGDQITKEFNLKDNVTVGMNSGLSAELFGFKVGNVGANYGVRYNNYKGVGYTFGASVSADIGPFRGTLGGNYSSDGGFGINPSLSFSQTSKDAEGNTEGKMKMSVGTSVNSRTGMKSLNYGAGFTPGKSKIERSVGSGNYTFGTKTWVPSISMPMSSTSLSLNATAGTDMVGMHPNATIGGSYSVQKLQSKKVSKKAYGYLYEHNKGTNDNVLLDFNREKDGSFNENSTNLPLSNHTYDIMSASGHGIGGSFRAKRSDVAALHDDRKVVSSSGGSLGAEFGLGNIAHFGVDYTVNYNYSSAGLWKDGNNLLDKFNFQKTAHGDYEPAFFKSGGDITPVNQTFHDGLFGDKAIRAHVLSRNSIALGIKQKTGTETEKVVYPKNRKGNNIATERSKRNQVMSFLDAKEADDFGLTHQIENVAINAAYVQNSFNPTSIKRFSSNPLPASRKSHHMSEVSVLKEDGMRYIYGIPAYNNQSIEKSFNIGVQTGVSTVCQTGQASYTPGSDNTKSNTQGIDHFYSSTSTPAYAHSYLLTGVISPDYVDVTSNGISDDDLGSAVKFNYSRAHENYRWRVPYNQNKANYSEGLKSNDQDDKASYAYGEKEIWYTHSIEGKNHVALFKISQREDALGVANENGGKDLSQRQYKLDKIELYAKQDLIRYGSAGATPIKTVHFKYNYSLCPDVENNTGAAVTENGENINAAKGKLTLKEIYFTYGKSGKGRLNSYRFDYSSINPAYHLKGHDMWGNYKPAPSDCCGDGTNLSNSDFPYVKQDKTEADQNAQAWALTGVHLPSGGKIIVDYESDDYGYVQDKRAMQMHPIAGFGYMKDGVPFKDANKTYTKQNQFDLVFFDLQDPLTGGNAVSRLKAKYLEGIKDLQFTVYADINNKNNYEYVKGYAEIDANNCGLIENGATGWVAMKKVKLGDKNPINKNKKVSPVAKAIWNFARMQTPKLVYPYSPTSTDPKEQILSLLAITTDVSRMVEGFYQSLLADEFGKNFNKAKSWVRLNASSKMKLGGGARVKKIAMNDNWQEMGAANTGAEDEEYGQEYDYTITDKETGETFSSGVASFEPGVGRDENPFVLPRVIQIENKLVPNQDILMEEPIGESFYPGPSVGYRKVTSKSLTKTGVVRNGTGKEVSEFYTAYDYPVIVTETKLQRSEYNNKPFWSLFYSNREEVVSASQGYVIELNDMHGKPRANWSYSATSKEPISGTRFVYQDKIKNGKRCLENHVQQLKKDGSIVTQEIGVDLEMVNDFRENKDESISGGIQANVEFMVLFVAPLGVPTILPSVKKTRNEVYTAVTTKVINRTGIVKETIAFQEGSSISTKNHLYDGETGSLLLSSVQNEFKDDIYSFTQPAHWAYEGMGQAYKNIGVEFSGVTINPASIALPSSLNTNDYLTPGDELILTRSTGSKERAYVFAGDDGILNLINRDGEPYETTLTNCKIKVIRSGRRNLHNSPIGSIITKTNPLVQNGNNYSLSFTDIINTESMEYSEDWQTFIGYHKKLGCDSMSNVGYDWISILNLAAQHSDLFVSKFIEDDNQLQKLIDGYSRSPQLKKMIGGVLTDIDYFVHGETDLYLDYPFGTTGITEPYLPFDPTSPHYNTHIQVAQDKYDNDAGTTNIPAIHSSINTYYSGSDLEARQTWIKDSTNCLPAEQLSRNWQDPDRTIVSFMLDGCCPLELELPSPKTFKKINKFLTGKSKTDYAGYFKVEITKNDNTIDTIEVKISSGMIGETDYCYQLFDCEQDCYSVFNEDYVNPYRTGLAGNWHPLKAYKYLDGRDYNGGNKDPRTDGIYTNYLPFWTYNLSSGAYESTGESSNKWVWTSQTTKYTPFGNELETQDALGRYSSALFGYQFTTPIAVASNSQVRQIAYDGFEDYTFLNQYALDECTVNHFNFSPTLTPWDGNVMTDETYAHTGNYAMRITAGNLATISRQLVDVVQNTIPSNPNISRTLKPTDDVGIFRPLPGKYIVSAWIKEDRASSIASYSNANVQVKFIYPAGQGNPTFVNLTPAGRIINGWQRVEGEIDVPASAEVLELSLVAATDVTTWFDDVRVHPVDGNMASYAYDQRSMRLLGQLDENNYATIYEYDAEGTLIRVKKETEEGIKTLKETRNHYHKK